MKEKLMPAILEGLELK